MTGFPLEGVVGVVTSADDLDAVPAGTGGIELRADLFPSVEVALECLKAATQSWPAVLFTYRLVEQGGEYAGDDAKRLSVFRDALDAGAALVDAEWGSECARRLAADDAPLVVSHHDFAGMPSVDELDRWTHEMTALSPRAVKIVPTATRLADAARMLEWVERGRDGEAGDAAPRRVGFAMGQQGIASRVLSIARGAPFTYGALGRAVAPGQVGARELVDLYRAGELGPDTHVWGIVGTSTDDFEACSLPLRMHNAALRAAGLDGVFLPLVTKELAAVDACRETMPVDGLIVTGALEAAALELAATSDDRGRARAASDTLLWRDGAWRAHSTAYDGVLVPLRERLGDLRGAEVAVLGRGDLARLAVRALLEAGANPSRYYRNIQRGVSMADDLGVRSAHIDQLRHVHARAIVNAAPPMDARDDPVPPEALTAETVAFDLTLPRRRRADDPPETPFLRIAAQCGALRVDGRERIIARARMQFELLTGRAAATDALERGIADG